MQVTTRHSLVGIPHLFCPVEEGSNPGGDRKTPNIPKTPLCERERESERVGRSGRRPREKERESMGYYLLLHLRTGPNDMGGSVA